MCWWKRACLRNADRKDRRCSAFPVAIKDNIDVAGLPTTAGCPAFAYTPVRDAAAVARLRAAGALIVGKTNLDQFAAGLAGMRSPYGVPRNTLNAELVPGGSQFRFRGGGSRRHRASGARHRYWPDRGACLPGSTISWG